jgi:hypothetical protein
MFFHKQNKWKYNEHMSLFSDMVQRPGKNKILSVQFYNILSKYNAKIINILYTFLHFDNSN